MNLGYFCRLFVILHYVLNSVLTRVGEEFMLWIRTGRTQTDDDNHDDNHRVIYTWHSVTHISEST